MSDELHASSVADMAYAWGGQSDPGTETHLENPMHCIECRISSELCRMAP
jgi:hypothetical protein